MRFATLIGTIRLLGTQEYSPILFCNVGVECFALQNTTDKLTKVKQLRKFLQRLQTINSSLTKNESNEVRQNNRAGRKEAENIRIFAKNR